MMVSKTNNKCPLCVIPINETLLYDDNLIYLVSTKESKGHKVRIMAVAKRHTTTPTFEEQITALGKLIEYMSNLMNGQDFYVVSNQFATIPQHFHYVSCDLPLEDDDPLFIQTSKVVFPIRRK
jgi:hypothetical protein